MYPMYPKMGYKWGTKEGAEVNLLVKDGFYVPQMGYKNYVPQMGYKMGYKMGYNMGCRGEFVS